MFLNFFLQNMCWGRCSAVVPVFSVRREGNPGQASGKRGAKGPEGRGERYGA